MGVGTGEELVSKSGSKEEEMSETKYIICFKELMHSSRIKGTFQNV